MDDLYNEPASRHKEFLRLLSIPAKIDQEKVSLKRRNEGPERKQNVVLGVGIMNLLELDYWPRIGDEFTFRNILHEISLVHIDPSDYWQQSGWPLHVTIKARQVQFGDWPLSSRSHERLADTGSGAVPSLASPDGPQPPSITPGDSGANTGRSNAPASQPGSDGVTAAPDTQYIDLPPPSDPYC